ncbi:MAG TPA: cytochrome c [Aquabacterium sp.]|nr:cytochrome c [Aquabacterium sp.]
MTGRGAAAMAAGVLVAAVASAQPAVTNPRSLHVLHCAGCHGMDASGVPGQGVPTMRGNLGLFMQRPEGRAFLLQVPGVNNAGLTDAQIAQDTNWMVTAFSADTAPPGWPADTAGEVAAAKAARPSDVTQARADLVARLAREGITIK